MPRPKKPSDSAAAQRKWRSRPADKKRRAERNAARKKAEDAGKVRKGDGKEVHHTSPNGKTGSLGNRTRVTTRDENRSIGHPTKAKTKTKAKKRSKKA